MPVRVVDDDCLVCMSACRLCQHRGALAATANALLLHKCLRQRLWDTTALEVRQLPGIGKLLGERLAAAGLGRLRALAAAEPRCIEAVTLRHYPFGAPAPIPACHEATASLAAFLPGNLVLLVRAQLLLSANSRAAFRPSCLPAYVHQA